SSFAGSGEDGGIGVGKENAMQGAHGFVYIVFVDDEADVYLRRALRDHANVGLRQRAEDFGGDAASAANVFADQADDGFASFVLHVGESFQVGGDLGNSFSGVDGERHADF